MLSQAAIDRFQEQLPHREPPFNTRAWGHPLHSLCSYQGKLKPGLAHCLIQSFTDVGDVVLDPLAGVGTIPLEACLAGRTGIANDLSPLAATVASAKVQPLDAGALAEQLAILGDLLDQMSISQSDYDEANFGLNGAVRDYYHPSTLEEVLRARKLYLEVGASEGRGPVHAFIWSSILHILHGNRPYALSRTSHPITPFSPSGPVMYKSLLDKTRQRALRTLSTPFGNDFVPGIGFYGDFRELPGQLPRPVDAIITSPPFVGMRFDRPNWLRLWFCGWTAEDFHIRSLAFLEREQVKSFECYADFFDKARLMIKDDGRMIVHVGSGRDTELVDALRHFGGEQFKAVGEVIENVADIEQHGLSDKGRRTSLHHLLFFEPR